MSKPKRRKAKARRARRRIKAVQRGTYSVVGVGDLVHRGKGKRRQLGRIVGWSFDGKRRLTWIVVPR